VHLVGFYSLSSLILSNLKHELLNRLRSTMAANVLKKYLKQHPWYNSENSTYQFQILNISDIYHKEDTCFNSNGCIIIRGTFYTCNPSVKRIPDDDSVFRTEMCRVLVVVY
jgi:hypothetical protein